MPLTVRFILASPKLVGCGRVRLNLPSALAIFYGRGLVIRSGYRCQLIRSKKSKLAYEMLKSLGLRRRGVTVISCPSCARQQFDVIKTVQIIEDRLEHIDVPITVSIIGCVVNGPGEARETDIGLTGGGKGTHQIYLVRHG